MENAGKGCRTPSRKVLPPLVEKKKKEGNSITISKMERIETTRKHHSIFPRNKEKTYRSAHIGAWKEEKTDDSGETQKKEALSPQKQTGRQSCCENSRKSPPKGVKNST